MYLFSVFPSSPAKEKKRKENYFFLRPKGWDGKMATCCPPPSPGLNFISRRLLLGSGWTFFISFSCALGFRKKIFFFLVDFGMGGFVVGTAEWCDWGKGGQGTHNPLSFFTLSLSLSLLFWQQQKKKGLGWVGLGWVVALKAHTYS